MQITTMVPEWWRSSSACRCLGRCCPDIGNVLGGTILALQTAQGPTLDIPQMAQSRTQFGVYGAALPLILVWPMYIGFFASSSLLGRQTLSAWTGMPIVWSIIIVSSICTIAAVIG